MTHPIVDMLERGLEFDYERQQEEEPRAPGLHVSHVTKCERQTYFELTDTPKSNPLSIDSLINFKVGRAVEDAFTSILSESGAEIVREAEVVIPYQEATVTGHIDTIAAFLDSHMVVELKSTSSRSMHFTKRTQGKEDHRRQLHLYMHASQLGLLDDLFGKKVRFDVGFLTYLVKDATKGEQVIYPFDIQYDPVLAVNDLADMLLTKQAADRGEDPGVPESYGPNHWMCRSYCQWRSRCFGAAVRSER